VDIGVIIENLPLYVKGLWVTIQLVTLALICGLLLAVPLALAASSRNIFMAFLPKAYIYFFRGTPLLVQMYIIYYGMAQFEGVRESFIWVVFQEAFGEIEAAKACGMSTPTMYRRIILPGAFRRALPAYGNEVIFMLHGSALAGVITIVDLFGAARIVNSRHFVPFESYIAAGFFYLCMTFMIVWLFKIWEKRWHAHLRPRETVAAKPAALAPGGLSD
jgi:arginine/ornithine transport system permease protein